MKVYFYCSYSLSAYGFQFTSVDFEKEETFRVTKNEGLPEELYTYFTNAGASVLCGTATDGAAFFMLNGIKQTDLSVKDDDQGRVKYLNVVFTSDERHTDSDLFKLVAYALSDYSGFQKYLALQMTITPETHEGYTMNAEGLKKLFADATSFVIASTGNKELDRIINYFYEGPAVEKFYLGVLLDSWAYALDMYKLKSVREPHFMISQKVFDVLVNRTVKGADTRREMIQTEKVTEVSILPTFSKETLIACTCVAFVAGMCLGYLIGR